MKKIMQSILVKISENKTHFTLIKPCLGFLPTEDLIKYVDVQDRLLYKKTKLEIERFSKEYGLNVSDITTFCKGFNGIEFQQTFSYICDLWKWSIGIQYLAKNKLNLEFKA